ncbi:unnamed protein product [Cuscuta epithymum]|uniref:Uncharacterized protein n=1 Tax=Cuscuta epithymum TaxID=186058 RepID=A0AAV0E6J3_9ASTE|nr:unnamed protein product [Cuscuta epithymum]
MKNLVRWLFSKNYLVRLFLLLLGNLFGRFLGKEGTAIITTTCVSFSSILLVLSLVMAFPYLGLKGPLKRLIYIFLVFSVGFVGYFIRIEVIHLVDLALPPLFEYFCLVWDVHVIGGVLASTGPYGAERSPPAGESQTEEGEPSVNQGTEEAGPVLPANPGGQEAANQAPPYVPYPYQPNEVIGGDSVEYIERRLLERLVFLQPMKYYLPGLKPKTYSR